MILWHDLVQRVTGSTRKMVVEFMTSSHQRIHVDRCKVSFWRRRKETSNCNCRWRVKSQASGHTWAMSSIQCQMEIANSVEEKKKARGSKPSDMCNDCCEEMRRERERGGGGLLFRDVESWAPPKWKPSKSTQNGCPILYKCNACCDRHQTHIFLFVFCLQVGNSDLWFYWAFFENISKTDPLDFFGLHNGAIAWSRLRRWRGHCVFHTVSVCGGDAMRANGGGEKCQRQKGGQKGLSWLALGLIPASSGVVPLESPSSLATSTSLTKLEGKSPDLPLMTPLHQPSSTCAPRRADSGRVLTTARLRLTR